MFRAECVPLKPLLEGKIEMILKVQTATLQPEFDISLNLLHLLNHHLSLKSSLLSEALSDVLSSISHLKLSRYIYQL